LIDFDIRVNNIDENNKALKILEDIASFLFKEEDVTLDYYVNVIVSDKVSMKKINNEYRKVNEVTDVLSFPLLNYEKGKVFKDMYKGYIFKKEYFIENFLYLGDVLICIDKVIEQSKEYDTSFLREISYLMVHSFLHLLGYDHILEEDKIKMRTREEFILEKFFKKLGKDYVKEINDEF